MKIRNFKELAITDARRQALQIADAGLDAIDTERVIRRAVELKGETLRLGEQEISLVDVKNLYAVAIGKCALDAATVLEDILGDRIRDGIALDIRAGKLDRMRVRQGDHPMPSERNVNATREIIELLRTAEESDLVLFIISGGGSTLLCQPRNFSFSEEAKLLKLLFEKGATIQEINLLRKHLSLARGGFLAHYAHPARAVSLIFSDVPGDEIDFISSGPTVPDPTTVRDAAAIITKFGIDFEEAKLIETPKDKEEFKKVVNILAASNREALETMARKAEELGLSPKIVDTRFAGEAEDLGRQFVRTAADGPAHSVFLYGGESTVHIKGHGTGGRNQTLALAALTELRLNQLILTLASDGRDNTDYAGALCDAVTRKKAECFDLKPDEFLKDSDSYNFFRQTGDYLLTGDTGSNVSDLVMVINE